MTHTYIDGDELRRQHAQQVWVDQFRASLSEITNPDLIQLSGDGYAVELAEQIGDHGEDLRRLVRHVLSADADHLRHVRHLQDLAAGRTGEGVVPEAQKKLDAMGPDQLARADCTQEVLALVAGAFERADLIALTDWAALLNKMNPGGPQIQTAQPQSPFRVQVPMLSHPAVRARTGVHGVIRSKLPRADGYGKHNPPPDPSQAADGNPGDASGQPEPPPVPPRPGRRDKQLKNRNQKRRPVRERR